MRRLVFGLLVLAAPAACGTAVAQPPPGLPSPRITTLFPAGAKAGPTPEVSRFGVTLRLANEVTVTGTDLDEPQKLVFSHPGITGEYVPPPAPPADPKKKDAPPPKPNPAGPHKFRVTVAPDVPPGNYEVRFVGRFGVSNPRAFVVGSGEEFYEKEPNNDLPEAQRVELGTTVNGVLSSATDVDYTVFSARKGQRVVAACLSSSIDGRANPMIEVYDAAGRRLAANRNYRDNDAVTDLVIPEDGDYYVRLCQFAYQGGGPDCVYRLSIGTAPWIDAVFPPAVEPGKPTPVTLYGRNLPNGQPADGYTVDGRPLEKLTVTVTPPSDPSAATRLQFRGRIDPVTGLQDGFEYTLQGPNGWSNPVPIYFTRDKLVVKQNRGGTTAATAEPIPAPCEVVGFISRRGDSDWYRFDAKKGDRFVIEVLAERIGTAADFFFSVRDGKDPKRDLSGEQDDDPDSLHPLGFYSRSTDPPPYRFTAPEDGSYLVLVGCRESSVTYGPRSVYRLRVGRPDPDFRVVAMPYSRHYQTGANLWQGGTLAFDLFVHRTDGYSGPVTVTAEGLPAGVTARPVTVGPSARWGTLVLSAAAAAPPGLATFSLTATGTTADGRPLTRPVRPAAVIWGLNTQQQQVPVVSRLVDSFVLAVVPEKAFFTLAADPANAVTKVNMKDEKLAVPLTVKQGEKFTVPLKVNWLVADKQNVTLAAEPIHPSSQASPVTVQIATQPTADKPEAALNFDVKANAPPGTYCVTLKGTAQVPYAKPAPAGGTMPKGTNVPAEAFSDPIEVTVIPTALAKVTVGNLPNNTLTAGTGGDVLVRVERQYDYAGEFRVRFDPPPGLTGVTAEPVTIPAGANEVKLLLKAAADAKPGAVNNATITVTAVYGGKHTITHEAKVNFTVAAAPKKK